jgi:ABC-type transport system involved in cytochrome bd biosynthesis fused ATPase/permease subunit
LDRWLKGGTDLSVGEWRRIALDRALLRPAQVIILDEPTSAMDPWAEGEWLRRFSCLAAGRTAVLVTHRLTTAAVADRIYVMEGGGGLWKRGDRRSCWPRAGCMRNRGKHGVRTDKQRWGQGSLRPDRLIEVLRV